MSRSPSPPRAEPVDPAAGVGPGATWDGGGVAFSLFSAHAEAVEVCLFDPAGRREVSRVALGVDDDGNWSGRVPGIGPGTLYGYRVYGPYAPQRGHRFNHHKLLIDPYARLLRGEVNPVDALCGYRVGDERGHLSFDLRDSAPYVPKCVVLGPPARPLVERPDVPPADAVIYEAHVRGLTMLHPGVRHESRGTVSGLADPAVVDHLRHLGVTAVELLPVQAFATESFLARMGLGNYWGYNTLAFHAPHARYLAGNDPDEVVATVDALHAAGLEVILDVVYNHTAEGSELGPTLSLRGIDNASYYGLDPDDPSLYGNPTGTGNALDFSREPARRLMLDSLRRWAEMGVDGFRFDLASVLGRGPSGFDPAATAFREMAEDETLSGRTLIAEPWDVGPGGYQLGGFPAGWSEWNDRFRDSVRRFWTGEAGTLGGFARAMAGSAEIFEASGRPASASINFVTAHDGFTLRDLVSYDERHNEANGEDNRDGHSANHSANHGVEGPTDDPEIAAIRARQQRNLLASLLTARGVPMLLAGDEFGRTQAGNNNAYCQDNEISWVDWEGADHDLAEFTAELIALRRAQPALGGEEFLHDDARLAWFSEEGEEMTPGQWEEPERRALAMRVAPEPGAGPAVLICVNADAAGRSFRLPTSGASWEPAILTGGEAGADGRWDAVPWSLAIFTASEPGG